MVSIPFKREGISELVSEMAGKKFTGDGFQFPSNGKAFPNRKTVERMAEVYNRFNSLQTGRHFRTSAPSGQRRFFLQVSIPFKREGISELV